MPYTINEAWESGDGSVGQNAQQTYAVVVTGDPANPADDNTVAAMVAGGAAFSQYSPYGQPIADLNIKRLAAATFLITATYGSVAGVGAVKATNDSAFSFSTSGGTEHISTSKKTKGRYGPNGYTATATDPKTGQPTTKTSGTPPTDHKGSIGVSGNSVEGVDIEVNAFDFKTTFYVPREKMTADYVTLLYTLGNHVNSDKVTLAVDGIGLSFNPGELRFRYAEGQPRPQNDWELSLAWSARANKSDIVIAGVKGPITKEGQDYLWCEFQPAADTTSNAMAQVPKGVYVEEVYDRGVLSPLQPGLSSDKTTRPAFTNISTDPSKNPGAAGIATGTAITAVANGTVLT